MAEPFEQWSPAFAIPLSGKELALIGRIAVMWSQIDHYTDRIIMRILQLKPKPFALLMTGRMLGSKLQLLKDILVEIPDEKIRASVAAFRQFTNDLISDRNVVFHGLWTLHTEEGKPNEAKASRRSGDALPASAIKDLERRTARATVLVAKAAFALEGNFSPRGQTIHISLRSFKTQRGRS